jgi:hypothetical protein
MENKGEIIIYKSKDGSSDIEVKLDQDTVWLSQTQLVDLFGKSKKTISEHISNIFEEKELSHDDSTVRNFRTVQKESGREIKRNITFYNLDVIISVGYRVKSLRGTQFRIWATNTLKDHLIKGYTINQKRLMESSKERLLDLERSIDLVKRAVESKHLELDEAQGLLNIITEYTKSWVVLNKFDENKLTLENLYSVEISLKVKFKMVEKCASS